MTSSTCWTRDVATASALVLLAWLGACGGAGTVVVRDAWARPAVPDGPGAVYLAIENGTRQPDRLVGASSDVCATVELHRTELVGDRMTMRPVLDGVSVEAGQRVAFEPGGLHVMLLGLRRPLELGATFELVLEFERAGRLPVTVEVRR